MKYVDLHTHSTASDGTFSPTELMKAAKNAGLEAIALTDHDTPQGLSEAEAAAKELGLEFVPGVEFSAVYLDREVHIVGLYINDEDSEFIATTKHFNEIRNSRNDKMLAKLREAGFDITLEKIRETDPGIITRANMAKYLVRTGACQSIAEVFEHYLEAGRPCYVPKTGVSPKEVIEAILKAGGVPILAHPLLYHLDDEGLHTCIKEMKRYGLLGIETRYSTYTEDDDAYVDALARTHHLIPSGGSDFHGSVKPHISLMTGTGRLKVPYEFLETIKSYAASVKN